MVPGWALLSTRFGWRPDWIPERGKNPNYECRNTKFKCLKRIDGQSLSSWSYRSDEMVRSRWSLVGEGFGGGEAAGRLELSLGCSGPLLLVCGWKEVMCDHAYIIANWLDFSTGKMNTCIVFLEIGSIEGGGSSFGTESLGAASDEVHGQCEDGADYAANSHDEFSRFQAGALAVILFGHGRGWGMIRLTDGIRQAPSLCCCFSCRSSRSPSIHSSLNPHAAQT